MDIVRWIRLEWDRFGAWVCVGAGAVVVLVGWLGVSRTAYPAEQIPYIISGGVGGVFLLGLGAMLWLSADLRDEWRKLDRIEEAIRGQLTGIPPARTEGREDGVAEHLHQRAAADNGGSVEPRSGSVGSFGEAPDGHPDEYLDRAGPARQSRSKDGVAPPTHGSRSESRGQSKASPTRRTAGPTAQPATPNWRGKQSSTTRSSSARKGTSGRQGGVVSDQDLK
jgi:hypothetical protein